VVYIILEHSACTTISCTMWQTRIRF